MSGQVPRHLIDEMCDIMYNHGPDELSQAEVNALLAILRPFRDRLDPPKCPVLALAPPHRKHSETEDTAARLSSCSVEIGPPSSRVAGRFTCVARQLG
jgi:hypothetical protein